MKTRIPETKLKTRICSCVGRRIVLAVSGMLVAGGALGADSSSWTVHPYLQDRWTIQLGVFYPDVSTTARLDNSALGRGTEVDFEDDLDLTDRKALGSILASVRLGERWRIEAEYFALNREGTRAINRTINWGDNTYTVGTVVSSSFDSDVYRLSGGYSFIKDKQSELGVALGLFTTDFKASLSAPGIGSSASDALAPLPTIGVYGAHAFTPRWLMSGRVDYFSLNYDQYDGSLTNFQIALDYRFTRHFGVGAGYRYVHYNLESTKSSWHGEIDYKFSGPMLYGVASF
jgi:hypothetical protein